MIPLFKHYPLLGEKLPYVSLGEFPTPVQKLDRLGKHTGANFLYIKRDDITGKIYGGNKVRKLEFILGNVLKTKAKEVLTFGFAGSNHALATTIYGHLFGLRTISMLLPQPNAFYVRDNLLISNYYGAELHEHSNIPFLTIASIYHLLRHKIKYGRFPSIVPAGGSSFVGTIGYVNAAFELKEQIMEGIIPEPDYIYVTFGSMGTVAGLNLGLRAAKLKTKIIAIQIIDKKFASLNKLVQLFHKTIFFLSSLDYSFPKITFSSQDIDIREDFKGQGYACFSEQGLSSITCMKEMEEIKLDGTYTGKTLAALINDAQKGFLQDKVVLFWNTYNSRTFPDIINNYDHKKLPKCFYKYFEQDVQPLDKP